MVKGISVTPSGSIVLTGDGIVAYRLLALRSALKLEVIGLRSSRWSAYATVKREFGLKGNKARVLMQFETYLRNLEILVD